ncbi:intraflagellar transport protein 74 [Marchantia polymorpha subsp. ruderalis]|uniref:Uncharacterized protein n=2 Tax=Marchantia polymorpha TaxID=3197 RepID=A0AAF6BPK8_MARPO|nr:hypothetical protein MARPO_0053s0077 [Marchantia polymorpha]BBN13942.1 hypothetical protein Mp_6g07640 [Marchantia polymorpha subsp. ruderalis]|eukprot:PTQ38143.1 hypothetical protein MARPO_0053s0077 [Marchantia polymorpha]
MSSSGRRGLQAAEVAEILMAGSPQRGHSSMSTYRPTSGQSSTIARPLTGRSERNVRPHTPGGSIGLDTPLTVESRPVTHHGMISMRSPSQGPGRKILDKSYFLGKLRSKKQELQAEIDSMTIEIDRLQKMGPASVHLEHHQESLVEEVKILRGQLGDYNTVMEKVAAGVDLEQLKDNIKTMKETIDNERKKIDQIFSERSQKEREAAAFEKDACLLEAELERRLDHVECKVLHCRQETKEINIWT